MATESRKSAAGLNIIDTDYSNSRDEWKNIWTAARAGV